jgi:hypothetical protein
MTELKATNMETARYKDHLKDDLKLLLLDKGKLIQLLHLGIQYSMPGTHGVFRTPRTMERRR